MVGEYSARTSTGTQFCRVSAIAPGRACEEPRDICSDPAAVRMVWDSCAREFVGAFTVVMSYEEGLCNAQPNCSHFIRYRASTGDSIEDCPGLPTRRCIATLSMAAIASCDKTRGLTDNEIVDRSIALPRYQQSRPRDWSESNLRPFFRGFLAQAPLSLKKL